MAADPSEVETSQQEEGDALYKKAMRMLASAQSMITEASELLAAYHDPKARQAEKTDKYGEPTWNYRVALPIPKDIYLTRAFIEYAEGYNFSKESAEILFNGKGTYEGFKGYYARVRSKQNGKWSHWTLVWQKWVRKERERKDQAQSKSVGGGDTRFSRSRTRG